MADVLRSGVVSLTLALLLSGLLGCGSSGNTKMNYTFAGAASGSLGSTSFNNATFTLTMTADTRAVTSSTNPCAVPSGVCQLFLVPATTTIFSLPQQNQAATFTTTAEIFVNQTFPAVGLQRSGTQTSDMLDIQDQAFATYDLKSSIGPVTSSSAVVAQFNCNYGCVETSMGVLTINSVSNLTFASSSP